MQNLLDIKDTFKYKMPCRRITPISKLGILALEFMRKFHLEVYVEERESPLSEEAWSRVYKEADFTSMYLNKIRLTFDEYDPRNFEVAGRTIERTRVYSLLRNEGALVNLNRVLRVISRFYTVTVKDNLSASTIDLNKEVTTSQLYLLQSEFDRTLFVETFRKNRLAHERDMNIEPTIEYLTKLNKAIYIDGEHLTLDNYVYLLLRFMNKNHLPEEYDGNLRNWFSRLDHPEFVRFGPKLNGFLRVMNMKGVKLELKTVVPQWGMNL